MGSVFSVNAALVLCLGRDEGFCQGEVGPICGLDLSATLIQNNMKEISVCPSWYAGRSEGCQAFWCAFFFAYLKRLCQCIGL